MKFVLIVIFLWEFEVTPMGSDGVVGIRAGKTIEVRRKLYTNCTTGWFDISEILVMLANVELSALRLYIDHAPPSVGLGREFEGFLPL